MAEDRSTTRFYLTTTDDPYSQSAFGAVRAAQDVLAAAAPGFGPHASAYLGGPTAEFADVQAVLARDFQQVAIVTIIGILIVLMILLRAFVAPLYLVGTVLLSCATALGLSAWFFQSVLGQAGVSFYLPLLVFVLLVALGSDYNIFLMSRVREESAARPIRDGIRIASGRTGAVITSAGLILAGTFGSMVTAPADRPRPGRCDGRVGRPHRHVRRALHPRPGDCHARRRVVLVAVRAHGLGRVTGRSRRHPALDGPAPGVAAADGAPAGASSVGRHPDGGWPLPSGCSRSCR